MRYLHDLVFYFLKWTIILFVYILSVYYGVLALMYILFNRHIMWTFILIFNCAIQVGGFGSNKTRFKLQFVFKFPFQERNSAVVIKYWFIIIRRIIIFVFLLVQVNNETKCPTNYKLYMRLFRRFWQIHNFKYSRTSMFYPIHENKWIHISLFCCVLVFDFSHFITEFGMFYFIFFYISWSLLWWQFSVSVQRVSVSLFSSLTSYVSLGFSL